VHAPPLSGRISVRHVLAEAWRLGRARFRPIFGAAVAVFVPVGFLEALELHQVQADDIDVAGLIAFLLVAILFSVVTLLGEVLYSGVVAAIAKEDRGAPKRSLREIARRLPYARLLASDVLFALVVAAGLVALIVPGFVFLAWFSLAAAVIEVENRSVRAAFGRSRALVRLQFWRSLALVVTVTLATELLQSGIAGAVAAGLGDSLIDRWIEAGLSGIITAPVFALPIVVLYFELATLHDPPLTSSGTVTNS
jgi:hypothetical protein